MAEIGTITTLFLTAAGLRLQAKVQGKKIPLILTRAKIGYGYLQDNMDLKALTGLINEVPSHQTGEEGTTATVDLTRVYDDTEEGMAYVGVTVKNGDNPRFYLREFAIYAEDPNVGEICYGIANLGDEAPPISPYDKRNHIEFKYDFPTVIANADDVVANITLAADTPWEDFVRLENIVKGLSAATFFPTNAGVLLNITAEQVALWNNMISMLMKGAANGVAELDENGMVPASQLPSYVDDVIECNGISAFPTTGESGKIYVDILSNLSYRWSGSQYTEISKSIAIGETSATAYRGDRGKAAYEHSQLPHAPTTAATHSDMGLMSALDKKYLDAVIQALLSGNKLSSYVMFVKSVVINSTAEVYVSENTESPYQESWYCECEFQTEGVTATVTLINGESYCLDVPTGTTSLFNYSPELRLNTKDRRLYFGGELSLNTDFEIRLKTLSMGSNTIEVSYTQRS